MKMLGRVGIWACSLGFSELLFSLAFSLLANGEAAVNPFFTVTMRLAFPAWCLYLPLVLLLKSSEGWRKPFLLLTGALIGPATVFAMALLAIARGTDARSVWQGDPLDGIGVATGAAFAAIVGVLTVASYLVGLRLCFRLERSTLREQGSSPLWP